MAVWILSDAEQTALCALYAPGLLSQRTLAEYYGVSANTIGRVLKEHSVAKVKTRLHVEQMQLLQYLQENNLTLNALKKMKDRQK